jgi:hypothetical protein
MVEPQPSKLVMRFRLPSPALSTSGLVTTEFSSERDPEAACGYAEHAPQQLAVAWYATGMNLVLDVRKALQPWADQDCVQALDDQLYGWQATLSTLQR